MNTLPTGPNDPPAPGSNAAPTQAIHTDQVSMPTGVKEGESIGLGSSELPLADMTGSEMELPREAAAAGVRMAPTTVPIPPSVTQMGVISTGSNVPATPAATIALPLTDDQIAVGLKKNVKVSIRWLAEWCVRKIKQLHHSLLKK